MTLLETLQAIDVRGCCAHLPTSVWKRLARENPSLAVIDVYYADRADTDRVVEVFSEQSVRILCFKTLDVDPRPFTSQEIDALLAGVG